MATPLKFMLQPGQATENIPDIGKSIYSVLNLVEISYEKYHH
jgi:hypothetical protein